MLILTGVCSSRLVDGVNIFHYCFEARNMTALMRILIAQFSGSRRVLGRNFFRVLVVLLRLTANLQPSKP